MSASDITQEFSFIGKTKKGRYVIHEHHASRLHFDLRLEIAGTLKSWAVPKGPSLNPREKRLAVAVSDHTLSYIDFEGSIAEGKYGAGEVRIWDRGDFTTKESAIDQYEAGKLNFVLAGEKLRGEFNLVKMKKGSDEWLLIKTRDQYSDESWKIKTVLSPRKK